MRAAKVPHARDLSSEYVVTQIKAQMAEQCAIEVEATKALYTDQLVDERRRCQQTLEDREKRAEVFCDSLRSKYEELMLRQESTHQAQLLEMKTAMEHLVATHVPLVDHERLLRDAKAAAQQTAETQRHTAELDRASALTAALDAQRRDLEAKHASALSSVQQQLRECQVTNINLTRMLHLKDKEFEKQSKALQEERMLRAKKEVALQESCRHLLTLRNHGKAATAALRESKKLASALRHDVAAAQQLVAKGNADLVQATTAHAGTIKCLEQELLHVRQLFDLDKAAWKASDEKAHEKIASLKEALGEKTRQLVETQLLTQLDAQRAEQLKFNYEADISRAKSAHDEAKAALSAMGASKTELEELVRRLQQQTQVLEERMATAAAAKEQMEAVARATHAALAQKVQAIDAARTHLAAENTALKQELRMEQQLLKRP
ncbi:hypothetical protein SPRG_18882 [Saprolegnia parasitica CBS 223.65]|uniref:Uncharacterized protein n=1 Tax=Saprolegnia parasitica (strain CBS 223.65) TaxID=695850 RepID=A0A067DAU8_SAPPC|nr:hypothetical protein SPRG_18882 [Saprolegnia parasitica CBS 223.65]KDO35736.1 hypothetical protein SPRG_18882 [Saprolegnia parasitica CBS 223.65]|eukprot:XP_012194096.1 hypothetical protein SPRG_18882 [Saprolegnia parasitica CBS 223.65]